jgi:hypothetical protein
MTVETKLKKWLNLVQRGYHPIQRCRNLVDWCKRVTAIKVLQFIIVKNNTILRVALVSFVEMTIRWIDTEQRTIAERVSASLTSGFPMMSVPCPAGASVSVDSNQSLTTVSTKPFLPLPSLVSYSLRKGSHSRTSKATRTVQGHRATTPAKDGWSWEGDEWMKKVGKRMLIIFHTKRAEYNIWCNSKWIGEARTLAEAKRKADAYIRKVRAK